MPKFSYEIIDYNVETNDLAVVIKTDDPKIVNNEELMHFQCPVDDDNKVMASEVREIILRIVQSTKWAHWNHQNRPNESPVGVSEIIGSTHDQEYDHETKLWLPQPIDYIDFEVWLGPAKEDEEGLIVEL